MPERNIIGLKKFWFLSVLVFYPLASAVSQGCFSDGYARLAQLENSGVEFPRRNKMIQESLLRCFRFDYAQSGYLILLSFYSG